ncbi:MAG: class II aldolase/adducin family protein [Kiritimatiellae bacterium]|nr:class II aldolase/adducin family protein [Kiritimatiellia bacterium]
MKHAYLHPRDELALTLDRIYRFKMTTTSGGNLSILDENGDIWITPARLDKGSLKPEEIVHVKKDGTVTGPYKPSSEYPFHKAIYACRPDIRAVVHAHPVSLVAFSCAKKTPDARITPLVHGLCKQVAFAKYGIPGSEDLGRKLAAHFAKGSDSVILESHGVCCGGATLHEAYTRFETIQWAAQSEVMAAQLGKPKYLTDAQLAFAASHLPKLASFKRGAMTIREKELRCKMCAFVERGYRQGLFSAATGALSVRLDAGSFLTTPHGFDRISVNPEDFVLVRNGKQEAGKEATHAAPAHAAVLAAHADVGAVITACPPNCLAFSALRRAIDTRTLPECYIFLREVGLIPFEKSISDYDMIARQLSMRHPAAVLENNGIMVVGEDVLSAFDKMEVLECSAGTLRQCLPLGGCTPMGKKVIDDIIHAFNLPK